jgi:hypothetical protein
MLGKIAPEVNAPLPGVTRPEPSGMPPSHWSTARLENTAMSSSDHARLQGRPRNRSIKYGSMRGHTIASARTAVAKAIAYRWSTRVSSARDGSERLQTPTRQRRSPTR